MDNVRADLAIYRLETARQCIMSAKALIEISDYMGATKIEAVKRMRNIARLCWKEEKYQKRKNSLL